MCGCIGDDTEVLVVDPAHDVGAILRNLHSRNVIGIVCTHGHNDHIDAAIPLAEWTQAPLSAAPRGPAALGHDATGDASPTSIFRTDKRSRSAA